MFSNKKPQEPVDVEQAMNDLVNGLIELNEFFDPIVDAVNSYRDKYMKKGFSKEAAENLAIQYHSVMMHNIIQGSQDQQKK